MDKANGLAGVEKAEKQSRLFSEAPGAKGEFCLEVNK